MSDSFTPFWLAESKRLIRKIARDDRPVYILSREMVDDRFDAIAETVNGFSGPAVDLSLRDLIGADWRGRGPAMFVNERRIRSARRWDSPAEFENRMLAICLHEAGHWYAGHDLFGRKEPSEFSEIEELAVGATQFDMSDSERNSLAVQPGPADEPWKVHGPSWIRMMCHIAYRASREGFGIPISEMRVAGRQYGLSHAAVYEYLLRDEVREQSQLPLLDVAEIPIPAAVIELFEEDCDRFIKRYLDQAEALSESDARLFGSKAKHP